MITDPAESREDASLGDIPLSPPRGEEGSTLPDAAAFCRSLQALRRAAEHCVGCPLYQQANQVVFGEGPGNAKMVIVGEVPGDREDLTGRPFVGPAGRLLDEGLRQADLDRRKLYLTNAVKHFKWEPRGKRRLHKRPSAREVTACRPWLEGELRIVRPEVIVCLGAVAAQSLLGRAFRITAHRGEILSTPWSKALIATWHPSAILRAPRESDRQRMKEELTEDLKLAAAYQ